jgi:hypothetical protein
MNKYKVAKKWLDVIENHENGIDYEYGGMLGNDFLEDLSLHQSNFSIDTFDLDDLNSDDSFDEYLLDVSSSNELVNVILGLWKFNEIDTENINLRYSTLKNSMIKSGLTKLLELERPNCIEINKNISKIELTSYIPYIDGSTFLNQELTITKEGKVNIRQYRSKSENLFTPILPREVDIITTVWIKDEEVSIIFDMIRDFFMFGYEVKPTRTIPNWDLVVLNGQVPKKYSGNCIDDYYQRLNKISDLIREFTGLEYINAFSLPKLSSLKSIAFEYRSAVNQVDEKWFFDDESTYFTSFGDLERSFKFNVSVMEILRNLDSHFFSNSVSWSDDSYASFESYLEETDTLNISFNYEKYSFYINYLFVKEALPIEWGSLAEKIREAINYEGSGIFDEKIYNALGKRNSDIPLLRIGYSADKSLLYTTKKGEEVLLINKLFNNAHTLSSDFSTKETRCFEVIYERPYEVIRGLLHKKINKTGNK